MLLPDTRELLPLCPTLLSPAEICCKTFGKKRGLVSAFANLWLLRLIFTAKYYNIEPSNSRLKSRECDGFSFKSYRVLRGVRVIGACIDFQLACIFKSVAREHSFDDVMEQSFRLRLHENAPRCRTITARVSGVIMPCRLLGFVACEFDFLGVDNDNIVARVNVRCISGLVLAR